MPFQKIDHTVDAFPVLFLGNVTLTRSGALTDMIIQARPVLADIFRQLPAAGPYLIKLSEKLYRVPDSRRIDIRAVVKSLILLHTSCEHDTRKCLVDRYTDIRVTLVILEHGIVFRPVLLDQIGFQHERFQLRISHYVFKMVYISDHALYLRTFFVAFLKILANPVLQTHRFSDINNRVVQIVHDINAGSSGKLFQFFVNNKLSLFFHCVSRYE